MQGVPHESPLHSASPRRPPQARQGEHIKQPHARRSVRGVCKQTFQLHRACLPAIHFIQSADHQQSLKLDEAKDEALRRQQELETEAKILQAGCSIPLDIDNKKGFEGPDLEKHPSNRFAARRGQQKSEAKLDVKRRKLADGGTVFDLMKASANAPLSEEAKRGRLHTAMHDSKFGLLAKVVPYLLFWAFGSVARCVSPHAACAFVHTWPTGQFHRVAVLIVATTLERILGTTSATRSVTGRCVHEPPFTSASG